MKHYIPEAIGQETPLRMENGEYSLEVTPLFGQEEDSSEDVISSEETHVSGEEADIVSAEGIEGTFSAEVELSALGSEDNAFREVEELSSVQVAEEEVTDIYGKEEKKNTAAVYSSEDKTFKL